MQKSLTMGQGRTDTTFLLVVLVSSCFLCPCWSKTDSKDGPLTDLEDYPYHERLDENYELKWKFNSTHIQFQAEVKAVGYIGLGISKNGDMYPGDMVIFWRKGGTVHFDDRHAKGHDMPIKDVQEDWHLRSYRVHNEGEMTMTVVRQLNTCDQEGDLPITKGTTRVIYAYSDEVPDSDNAIPYHGSYKRGSKSILLLDPPPLEGGGDEMPKDAFPINFLNDNYTVPGQDTTYSCVILKLPQLQRKHHLIRYEPVIQAGHEKLVHHIVLYFCNKPVPERLMHSPFECYKNQPKELDGVCDSTMIAWAIGGTAFNFPKHVGQSLGTAEDPVYFKFETHYDNVDMRSDLVDSSGLRMHLTKEIRQYDAGILEVGVSVNQHQIIPPKAPEFLNRGYCPSWCLEKALGDGEIHIFADFLHSHLLGKRMSTRLVRDGVELPPILQDDNYDFDYQETRILTEERVVKKGDTLITDCYYDSSKRTTVTYGGLSSQEEMCISFLLYYPRTSLTDCFTMVNYTKDNKEIYPEGVLTYVNKAEWSEEKIRDFATNLQTSDIEDKCYYQTSYESKMSSQPKKFKPYVHPDTCQEFGDLGGGNISSISVFSPALLVFSFLLVFFRSLC